MDISTAHYELTDHFLVPATIERVWEFFSTAGNLPKITPPWLGFTITTPQPLIIQKDAVFDYTIRWMNVPVKWRTRIIEWEPPQRFVDMQERGPYGLWWHEHRFEPTGGGVLCWDRVLYRLPFGPLGRLTHAMVVRRQLIEIFRHRRDVIGRELGGLEPRQGDVQIRRLGASEGRLGIRV